MRYLLVDTANLFSRARFSVPRGADTWTKLGFALHVTFSSLLKVHRLHKPDHIVFALEARSWRKEQSTTYKANRQETKNRMSPREAEEDAEFWNCYGDFTSWLNENVNSSVIRIERAEADDIIARWIALHPNDEHVILSNDSDFYQLLSENVSIYNGVNNEHITLGGVFDDKGKPVVDKKTKEHKHIGDPQFLLFEKCMRGDASDNIMSAYPGVRTKGSTKKVGLIEAYEDRDKRGWAWNNMMLQRWVDHEGVEHRVLDAYERNRALIDLTAQPEEIRNYIDDQLRAIASRNKPQIGSKLIKFCSKYELNKMSENVKPLAELLSLSLGKETENV